MGAMLFRVTITLREIFLLGLHGCKAAMLPPVQ